jgi:predicted O-linked N-acetylglucosamine transferase (SPINDLY family)
MNTQRLMQIAKQHHYAGRLQLAESSYREILQHSPRDADALHMLGILEAQRRNFPAALELIGQALTANPNNAGPYSTLGNVLFDLGRFEDSLPNYARALQLNPAFAEAFYNQGNALHKLHRNHEALASLERALALQPGNIEALNNRGDVLLDLDRNEEALQSFDRALAIRPRYVNALNNRGSVLRRLKRFEEAADTYRLLASVFPACDYVMGNLFEAQLNCCAWADYAPNSSAIVRAVGEGKKADTPFRFLALPAPLAAQQQCARIFVADRFPARNAPLWTGQRYAHGRIRLAYLSADFHNHATAYLMAELFETHDRQKFDVTAISFGPDPEDEMRARLRPCFDRFLQVRDKSDREVAQQLRDLEIDIAVDLKGHTTYARTGILAYRPAPIQVNYLGYPGTMGAGYIDYVFADRQLIRPGDEAYYDEKIVYLPDTYQANDSKRAIAELTPARAEAGLPEHGFVFCCFNNSYKIAPDMFDVWMRLLKNLDGSVLWLLSDNEAVPRNLRREAEARGVSPGRLIFAPKMKLADHLARHRLAGLFLDTLPYNAHTTASDALWAGLPVVSCKGNTFAGRVAGSLLQAVGLPELVTDNLADYEALASRLASSPAELAEIRARLAANRTTTPLFDANRFRVHIESAYVAMWERCQRGEAPAGFAVPTLR